MSLAIHYLTMLNSKEVTTCISRTDILSEYLEVFGILYFYAFFNSYYNQTLLENELLSDFS